MEESKVVYKRILALYCIAYIAGMYGMDFQEQRRLQPDSVCIAKPEEKKEIFTTLPATLVQAAAAAVDTSSKRDAYQLATYSETHAEVSTKKIEQPFETRNFQDQAATIMHMQEVLDTETNQLAIYKEQLQQLDASSKAFQSMKSRATIQENSIAAQQKQIDEYIAKYEATLQKQVATCGNEKEQFECVSLLYGLSCELQQEQACESLKMPCDKALQILLGSITDTIQEKHKIALRQTGTMDAKNLESSIGSYMHSFASLMLPEQCSHLIELIALHNNYELLINNVTVVKEIRQKLGHAEDATQLHNMRETEKEGLAIILTKLNSVMDLFQKNIKKDLTPEQRSEFVSLLSSTLTDVDKIGTPELILTRIKACIDLCQNPHATIACKVPTEQQEMLEFSTALNEKYSLCKTLQAKTKLIFELLALQEQLTQEGVPQGIIGLCETKINGCALNIRRELSALPQSRPDWLHDSHGARLTGDKPIEHAWQNFQTAIHNIKKCFTELIENKGALSSVRIEQLYRAKAACQDLEARINDVCRFGSDQVSAQDMSVTCKEREQLESTCEKLIAITKLFTKHMKVLPEVAPQQYYSSSYHEESKSDVVQEETMFERHRPKAWGALGTVLTGGLLKYCEVYGILQLTWGAGTAITGGVGLCIGGAIWAAIEAKRYLDRRAQTEVHLRTPISTHVYKIGEPEPDMAETFAYIRKQQALQQSSLSQPGRADDAVLQADGVTLLPKEAVQQPAKPAEAPSALAPTDKQLDKQQDKLSGTDSAKEESISITEGQIQGAMQIPIQREVLATTPGGSIPVETVSAEELKQEEHLSAALHDIAIITLDELKRTPARVLNVKRLLENVSAGFRDKWRQSFIEDIIQDRADLEILRALLHTDALDGATDQQERLYQAAVKPYLDETKQSIEDFMGLSWQEKYRIVIGNVFEQASTVVLFHTAKRYIPVVREKLPELVKFISEDKPLSAVQTPEGMRFVVETTPEFGTSPEAAAFMEAEETVAGRTKVPQQEVAPKVEPVRRDIEGRPAVPAAANVVEQGAQKLKFENFYNERKLIKHYERHVIENGEWGAGIPFTQEEYLQKARELINSSIGGDIEGFVSKNGKWTYRYNKATNEFAIGREEGAISTFYRPEEGITYWINEKAKNQ